MPRESNDIQRLLHIVEYCRKIKTVFDVFQNNHDCFLRNENYPPRDLCCFYILQIGELSSGLSEDFKNNHNEIPWRSIKGMRNIVAHKYGTIDLETVWEVLTEDIPRLDKQCRAIVLAWDSDFTKLTPSERARLEQSEKDLPEEQTKEESE